jgi:membrane protein required for colicin V production
MGASTHHLIFFDMVGLVIISVMGLRCAMRGFIKEAFSLAGIVLGLILARALGHSIGAMYNMSNVYISNAFGYATVLFAVILISAIAAWIISMTIKKTFLSLTDRLAGFAVGMAQGMLVVGLFVLVINGLAGSLDKSFLRDSIIAHPILGFMKFISGLILPGAGPKGV